MEIQKIFSDYYDEERLYSVLMDEDEIRMFTGVVKRANKLAKKAWQMKAGEKVLMDQGVKRYVSKGGKTVLSPEFSNTMLLKQKGRKLDVMFPEDVKDIHSRITAKGRAFQATPGMMNKTGVAPRFLDHNGDSLGMIIDSRRKHSILKDHPSFIGEKKMKAVSEFYPKKPWYKSWKKTDRKDLYNLKPFE